MNARVSLPLGPGIHAIDAATYHADPCETPSLSNSIVRLLATRTPRHAWMAHPRLNPARRLIEDAEQKFDIGSAAHSLLLEGEDCVRVIDAPDWRTNAAKAARDTARGEGLIPLLPRQHAAVTAMADAARAYIDTTQLRGIFQRGKPEQTVIWRDSLHVLCRARPDWMTDDYSEILDYKSTAVEGPGDFMRRNMVAHGYDTQAVFYPRGVEALGHRRPRFLFLVQEAVAPFLCYLVEPAASMVELATHKLLRALPLWRDCLASNRWPGYSVDVHQAEAPNWALQEEEAML